MNRAAVEAVDQWLQDKKITLWSTFDVSDEKQRRVAAEWFWAEIRDFMSCPPVSGSDGAAASMPVGQERHA